MMVLTPSKKNAIYFHPRMMSHPVENAKRYIASEINNTTECV